MNVNQDLATELERIYKNEFPRLLAVLIRIFGAQNYAMAEDVVQEAFGKALLDWRQHGMPDNPSAWLMRTAKNQAIDYIRARQNKAKFADDLHRLLESEWTVSHTVEQAFHELNVKDDQLRMIFMCCHPEIKSDNRLPFILRSLCGFSIQAISRALLLSEATVKKRLLRTRQQLKNHNFNFPEPAHMQDAMDTVHTVLYLLFNEGFHSSDSKQSTHLMFCQEAIGLLNLLIDEPKIANKETLSLLALMHFHIARIDARLDEQGKAIPLDRQNRQLWSRHYLNTASQLLSLACVYSQRNTGRYFYEAQIASEHCRAKTFSQTDWANIVQHYQALIDLTQSPVAVLNQAVAMGYDGAVDAAILQVESLVTHQAFKHSHMPMAVLAHLYAMAGQVERAYQLAENARQQGGTPHEHHLMMQQIERLVECG